MAEQAAPWPARDVPHTPPSAQDWVKHRSIISDLYRQYTLRDVRSLMEQNYSFKATERMYRTRIKSWRLDKKLKAREAQAVVRIVRQRRRVGLAEPTFRLRGKDISIVDALRYLKRKGLSSTDLDCTSDTQSDIPSDLSIVTDPDFDSPDADSQRQLSLAAFQSKQVSRSPSTPADAWHSQYIVSQVSNYFESTLNAPALPAASPPAGDPSIVSSWAVFNLYLCGAGLAARNDATGWRLMSRSLELLQPVFLSQDLWLLPQIFDLHLRREMATALRPERALDFLGLLQGWSESLLGTHHPITLVCYAINARCIDAGARLLADRVIAASFEKYCGKAHHYTKSARVSVCRSLHQLGHLEAARRAWCALIVELEALAADDDDDDDDGGGGDVWIRACLIGLASTYLQQGDLGNVHCVLHNFFERMIDTLCPPDDAFLPDVFPTDRSIANIIDCIRRSQIRIAEAEALIRVATGFITSRRGAGAETCRSIKFAAMVRDIDRNWNTAGKFDSVKCLKIYYGSMIERAMPGSGFVVGP